MKLSDFDYNLPPELIAQEPSPERGGSRMLVVHRDSGRIEDRWFRDFPEYIRSGDCLVVNDSRVLPSRLLAPGVEIFLLEPVSRDAREWRALVRPGKKLRSGIVVQFDQGLSVEIIAVGERGERTVRLNADGDVYAAIERLGHIPLPPYIKRADSATDRDRYQTVYSRERGSVAAPTAGLHFTGDILDRCTSAGATLAHVTLHVGLGTFQPVEREDFRNHALHYERYSISPDAFSTIQDAPRVIAVGTTSVRTIESAIASGSSSGSTNLFIHPDTGGAKINRVNALLTNFHLPRTSLLLLVCSLAGTELALAAYRHAVRERYRFFSYGDCMLIV